MKKLFNVHPDVIWLGLVSFLTDVSSEAIFSVFSIFFTIVAGASVAILGLVEGLADFSASSLDYLSGWLTDRYGDSKTFTLIGYFFSTLAKITLLVASSAGALAAFRVTERLGKSFRGPPRDAWLSTVAEEKTRGYSFGVHKAMDKSGAILGPLLAYFLLSHYGQTLHAFRLLFIISLVAAALAVVVLACLRRQPTQPKNRENIFKAWKTLSPNFKRYLIPAGMFSLAYFSFEFLLLKAYALGFAAKDVVLLYALFNVSFVLAAAPMGKLGDKIGRRAIILAGYAVYFLMSLGFIFAAQKWQVIILFLLFGFFYSIDEAQSKAFIADIEQNRRATAIGTYNFVTGLIYLPASGIAGLLWVINPSWAFAFAALKSATAIISFLSWHPKNNQIVTD